MLSKSFIMLALSITALSLPSAKEDLEKRYSWGWIASFASDDGSCNNRNIEGSRPEFVDDPCVNFTATTNRIGGSWGNGPVASEPGFQAFDDVNCWGNVLYEDRRKGNEDGFCQPLDESAQWHKWKSIGNWVD